MLRDELVRPGDPPGEVRDLRWGPEGLQHATFTDGTISEYRLVA
jgi:hypothetical protein